MRSMHSQNLVRVGLKYRWRLMLKINVSGFLKECGDRFITKKIVLYNSVIQKRSPFRVLTEWPEIMNPPCSVNYQGWDVECQKVIDWSSTENWNNFFKSCIIRLGHSLLMEGAQLVMNAQIKFETSTRVFSVVFELVK